MGQIRNPDHVWELIKDIPMALLITHDGERHGRPPDGGHGAARKKAPSISWPTRTRTATARSRPDSDVVLSFQKGVSFVVVYGKAHASDDRAEDPRDLWNAFDKAWWDGPEDPRIRLITVTPSRAEYWESPGKLIAYADMLVIAATGKRPSTGEHGQVRL